MKGGMKDRHRAMRDIEPERARLVLTSTRQARSIGTNAKTAKTSRNEAVHKDLLGSPLPRSSQSKTNFLTLKRVVVITR